MVFDNLYVGRKIKLIHYNLLTATPCEINNIMKKIKPFWKDCELGCLLLFAIISRNGGNLRLNCSHKLVSIILNW